MPRQTFSVVSTVCGASVLAAAALVATSMPASADQTICTPKWTNAAHASAYTSVVAANTQSLQSAISACSAAGTSSLPGLVDLKASGIITSAEISQVTLASNIVIKIEAGFTLKGLSYADANTLYPSQSASTNYPAMITSSKINNVTIKGSGILDGNGTDWWDHFYKSQSQGVSTDNRPKFIDLSGSNIKIGNNFDDRGNPLSTAVVTFPTIGNSSTNALKVKNAPKAQVEFESSSSNITVDGVWIYAPTAKAHMNGDNSPSYFTTGQNVAPNTDGIDLVGVDDTVGTTSTLVQNCLIDTGDDDIAIKSNKPPYYVAYSDPNGGVSTGAPTSTTKTGYSSNSAGGAVRNITIKQCVFGGGHGLSIGGQETGGVYNLNVSNIYFNGTDYGLRIKSDNTYKDSGVIDTVSYKNTCMQNVAEPILLTANYARATTNPVSGTPSTSSTFYVANAADTTKVPPHFPTASSSTTPWPYPPFIRNITFDNISATNVAWSGSNAPSVATLGEILGSDTITTTNGSVNGTSWTDLIATNITITNSSITTPGVTTPFTVNNGTLTVGKNTILDPNGVIKGGAGVTTTPENSGDTSSKGKLNADIADIGLTFDCSNSGYFTLPTHQ